MDDVWKCNENFVNLKKENKKLREEIAELKDILDNLNIQVVRDIAKGWVSVPTVEWDAVNWEEVLKPETALNQPKGEDMDKDKIEVGDTVTLSFNDGAIIKDAVVLHSPNDTGDSWHLKTSDGNIYYVMFFELMRLMEKGEG